MDAFIFFLFIGFIWYLMMRSEKKDIKRTEKKNKRTRKKNTSYKKSTRYKTRKTSKESRSSAPVKKKKIKDIFKRDLKREKIRLENNSINLYYIDNYHPYRGGTNSRFNTFSSNIISFKNGEATAHNHFYEKIVDLFRQINKKTNLLCVPSHSPNKGSEIAKLIRRLVKANPSNLNDCSQSLTRSTKIKSLSKSNGKRKVQTHLNSVSLQTNNIIKNYDNIILDDVCTTGSSMIGCSNILNQAGVNSIHHFCLARTYYYKGNNSSGSKRNDSKNTIDDDLPF